MKRRIRLIKNKVVETYKNVSAWIELEKTTIFQSIITICIWEILNALLG